MFTKVLTILFCLLPLLTWAQPPRTNVYTFQMHQVTDSLFELSNPQYLTYFNADGYNNQPHFISKDELYLTVQYPYDEQTEIYSLNLKTRKKTQVTATPNESEYSPTLMPDKKNFSSIRVEADANKTQRLWQFPIDRSYNGKPVFKYETGVGYHHWINNYEVAMFIVSDPNYLTIGDIRNDKTTDIANNVGRGFQTMPNGDLVYVHKITDKTWNLMALNPYTKRPKKLIKTLEGSEDFVILPDGNIIMGRNSKLYKFHPAYDKDWLEITDLRFYNIHKISRLAVVKDYKKSDNKNSKAVKKEYRIAVVTE